MLGLIIGILLTCLVAVIYKIENDSYLREVSLREKYIVDLQEKIAARDFRTIYGDLLFLASQNELSQLLEEPTTDKSKIALEYLQLSRQRGVYDQIRFLDLSGMEICRINYNNGQPSVVPEASLQSKADRYYFQETIQLERGGIFISPFDLNVESGQVERPFKPMIRFGSPVFDTAGKKRGIIVLNYLGSELIKGIESISEMSLGSTLLLNPEGYWLQGETPEDEWGFMFPHRKERRFQADYPGEWEKLQDEKAQIISGEGIFTGTTIYPLRRGKVPGPGSAQRQGNSERLSAERDYYWKLVSFVPRATLQSGTEGLLARLVTLVAVLFVLAGIPSYLVAKTITRRKEHQSALISMANYDLLTGLPNRGLFNERLEQSLRQARRNNGIMALLFIDLDNFKLVNDTFGHQGGDKLLQEVAARLSAVVRQVDTVARLGGDEFTIILSSITQLKDAEIVAGKIIGILERPIVIDGMHVMVSASIGVALSSGPEESADSLVKKADDLMYASKAAGKNTFRAAS